MAGRRRPRSEIEPRAAKGSAGSASFPAGETACLDGSQKETGGRKRRLFSKDLRPEMSVDDKSDSDLRKKIQFENFQLFCWITIKTRKHPVFGYWTRRNILPGVPPPPREAKEMVLQRREKRAPLPRLSTCAIPHCQVCRGLSLFPPFQFQTTVCSPPFLFSVLLLPEESSKGISSSQRSLEEDTPRGEKESSYSA